MLWLLLTGKVPTAEQTRELSAELAEKGELPEEIAKLIDSYVAYLFQSSERTVSNVIDLASPRHFTQ